MFYSPGGPLSTEEANTIKECVNKLKSAQEQTTSSASGKISFCPVSCSCWQHIYM